VNVVPIDDLSDAVQHRTVATQTVGVFPPARKHELRNRLISAGVQRAVTFGFAAVEDLGTPHDSIYIYPRQRLMR
jgi:Acyl-CoA reductase (LuxC)